MESFEERKKEYLGWLENNEVVTEQLKKNINTSYNDSDSKVEMFLNPKNERELKIVSLMFKYAEDSFDLSERIKSGDVVELPFENNRGVKKLIKTLIAIRLGKTDFSLIDKTLPPKERAEEVYQFLVCMADGEKITNYVAKEFGLDMENGEDALIFMGLWLSFVSFLLTRKVDDDDFEKYTDEEILEFEVFVNEFHTLCEQGRKEKDDVTKMTELITDAIIEAYDKYLSDNQDTDSHTMGK